MYLEVRFSKPSNHDCIVTCTTPPQSSNKNAHQKETREIVAKQVATTNNHTTSRYNVMLYQYQRDATFCKKYALLMNSALICAKRIRGLPETRLT